MNQRSRNGKHRVAKSRRDGRPLTLLGLRHSRKWLLATVLSLVGGSALSPSEAAAQSPLQVSVSPVVSFAYFLDNLRLVPFAGNERSQTEIGGGLMLGVSLDVHSPRAPVGLRGGWARSIGSDLRVATGAVDMSCGAGCSSRALTWRWVGPATVSQLWADAVLRPFRGEVVPYGFVGLARRVTSYSERVSSGLSGFASSDAIGVVRGGIGLRVKALSRSTMWIELAAQQGGDPLDLEASTIDEFGQQTDAFLAFGLAIPLFGYR